MAVTLTELAQRLADNQSSESLAFIAEYQQTNPGEFITSCAQIILEPEASEALVASTVVMLSSVFTPSLEHSIEAITALWAGFKPSARTAIKRAFFRCLMFSDYRAVAGGAHMIRLVAEIERRRHWPDLFSIVQQLYENSKTGDYSALGAVLLLSELAESQYVPPHHPPPAWATICYTVGCEVLIDARLDPDLRAEAARLLDKAMHRFIQRDSRVRDEDRDAMFSALGAGLDSAGRLHRRVFEAFGTFLVTHYSQLTEEHFDILLQATAASFESRESECIEHAIDLWREFAQFESNLVLEYHRIEMAFTPIIAQRLMEPLLEVMGLDTSEEAESGWSLSRDAYCCLDAFAVLAEAPIYELLIEYAAAHMSDPDEVSIMRMLFSIQLIARMPNVESDEFLQGIFEAVIGLTEAALPKLVCGAFAVILTIIQWRPEFSSCQTFDMVFQALQRVLTTNNSPRVLERALFVTREVFRYIDRKQDKGYLTANWDELIRLLYACLDNPTAAVDPLVLGAIFDSIDALLLAVPDGFCQRLGPFVQSIGQQLEATFVNVTPFAVRQRVGLAGVVMTLGHRHSFAHILSPLSGYFYDLLAQSYHADSSVDIIIAIAALFLYCREELDYVAPQAMGLVSDALADGGTTLLPGACLLLSDLMAGHHRDFAGLVLTLINALWNFAAAFPKDYTVISYVLIAFQGILTLNEQTEHNIILVWAELLLGFRDQLMQFIGNVRRILPSVDDKTIRQTIFLALLRVYAAVATLYDVEQSVSPNGKKRPGDFLDGFSGDFKDLVTTGSELYICSDPVLDAFLDFLKTIMEVFASFNNFNIKIHAPAFTEYLGWAAGRSDLQVKYGQVKRTYDIC
jgi:hypothetical protein